MFKTIVSLVLIPLIVVNGGKEPEHGCSRDKDCSEDMVCESDVCANPCDASTCNEFESCVVKSRTAYCHQPPNTTTIFTASYSNYEYMNLPVSGGSRIKFKVKARNDAHIMLAEKSNPTDSDPYYEIVLGGWSNSRCVIRKDRNEDPKASVLIDYIISQDEMRGFWIDYSEGRIAVGKENETEAFMSWTDPEPLKVKYMGVATGFESDGLWFVNEDGCSATKGCAKDRVCDSGVCYNLCHVRIPFCPDEYFCRIQSSAASCFKPGNVHRVSTNDANYNYNYFHMPADNSVIRFKVKAANDVHFMLAETSSPDVTTDCFLEAVIGGWSNTKSVIRDSRDGEPLDSEYFPGIVRDDMYRGFWVRYQDGTLAIGKENEMNPFLNYTGKVKHNFNYYGISTGFKSRGSWILYK